MEDKMKNLKKYLFIFFLLLLYTTICAVSYVNAVSNSISNEIFRLHVIANSDSDEDQSLKYIVRDNVLKYVNSLKFSTKQDLVNYLENNLEVIKEIAMDTVLENGFEYDVNVEIGHFDFPTKEYGDISFPAGDYDALRIKLGNSIGKNWWCVMFPPLCFVDMSTGVVPDSSKDTMKENIPEEEFALISDASNPQLNFKFKIVEFFNRK